MKAYHMSLCLHPVGRILTGNGSPKVAQEIEDALERHRPKESLSRLDSVYSRETTDFRFLGLDSGYIYCVAIRGVSQRHDARWIGFLQKAHLKPQLTGSFPNSIAIHWPDWTDGFVASTCVKYWAAEESDKPLWELLSNEAEVEAQLSDIPIEAAANKGGWQPKPVV